MEINVFTLYTNPVSEFFLFVSFVIIFHLQFIKIKPLSKKGWITMEYVILILGSISIIFTVADLRRFLMNNYYESAKTRTDFAYTLLTERVDNSSTYLCMNFIKSEYSPPNFEQIQKQYDRVCVWAKELRKKLPTTAYPQYPSLDFNNYKPSLVIQEPPLIQTLDVIKNSFTDYQTNRQEMLSYKNNVEKTIFEQILFFFSPFLLIIAFALAITKVTADRKALSKK